MQDMEPSSALKPSPIPQLLHCMNKHLLKLLFCPFLLLSSSPLYELTAVLQQIERYERRSQNPFSSSLTFSFLSPPLFFFFYLTPSLPASSVNTSCALALLQRIKSTHLGLALLPQMSALRLK